MLESDEHLKMCKYFQADFDCIISVTSPNDFRYFKGH